MRGHALRYAGWQIWDRTGPRVLTALFISVGFLTLVRLGVTSDNPPPPEQFRILLAQFHQNLAFIWVLVLTHGVVSEDRTRGYYRFYLAKPAAPTWFYGQHIVLAFAGALVSSAGYVIASSLLVRPLWHWALLENTVALFALFGMLVVFFSTLVRHDWICAVVVLIAGVVARERWKMDTTLGKIVNVALPPNHKIGWRQELDSAEWAWIGAWAAGLFLLSLLVLRVRPLGED